MNADESVTGPVNLGNPGEFSINELAKLVIAETGAKSDLTFHDLPEDDPCRGARTYLSEGSLELGTHRQPSRRPKKNGRLFSG